MKHKPRQNGISLLELSIVLCIVTLLGTGALFNLSAHVEQQRRQDAIKQLAEIRELILGFALSQGRLPCPASPALPNSDSTAGLEDCTRQHGVLPWITLATPEIDPWGHRLTYFASNRFTGTPQSPGGSSFDLDTTGNANVLDTTGKTTASAIPLIVLSHGPNGLGAYQANGEKLGTPSGSELENSDADLTFIQVTPGVASNDDLLTWISADQLKARLVTGGRLP